ncbi:putative reverse transcriptase domain-containing protein [Tanacetum coccineum]
MAPKRATRSNTAPEIATTTTVTNAQLQAMIDKGVTAALATRDANRSTNGDDSQCFGTVAANIVELPCKDVGPDVRMAMTWAHLKKKMTDKYNREGSGEEEAIPGIKPLCANATITNDSPWLPNATNATRQKPTCYECGAQGHFKRDCPKLKNNNRGNQAGNGNAPAKVYAVVRAGTNPDSNVVTGTFLLNNRYASVLFDTGADRSFVSTALVPKDGCVKVPASIVCAEKIVRISWGNETLIVRGDRSNQGNETRLNIISCTKTQKYMLKGCPIFLAHVTIKEIEDKSEKKQLEDVPIVRNFPKVFPKDLPGLSPTQQVEFQIDLIHGVAPIARAPYRLTPSEMKKLSEQLKELSDKGFIRPSSSP